VKSTRASILVLLVVIAGIMWTAGRPAAANGVEVVITHPEDGTVYQCPAADAISVDGYWSGGFTEGEVQVDDGPWCPAVIEDCMFGYFSATVPFPCCALGTHVIHARLSTDAGLVMEDMVTVEIVDTEPPEIHCGDDVTVPTDPGVCTARVTGGVGASDNCELASAFCEPPLGDMPLGTTTVTCTAIDTAGNTASCSVTVTVVDVEPPTITCPPDIVTCLDPGSCAKALGPWLGEPTATDNCDLLMLLLDAPAVFPVGTTVVTWRACDPSGNCSSCEQTVTVRPQAIFDPPITSAPFIGHWSPSGFILRRYAVLPIPFHLADCNGRVVCCDYDDVALLIHGPDRSGNIVTWTFSLANGKLHRFSRNCCYEAVFDARFEYPVMSGGHYAMTVVVNGVVAGSMPFQVW
jgi:hypothetical protein